MNSEYKEIEGIRYNIRTFYGTFKLLSEYKGKISVEIFDTQTKKSIKRIAINEMIGNFGVLRIRINNIIHSDYDILHEKNDLF